MGESASRGNSVTSMVYVIHAVQKTVTHHVSRGKHGDEYNIREYRPGKLDAREAELQVHRVRFDVSPPRVGGLAC